MGILDSTLRGGLQDWVFSDATGLLVPKSVRTVDSILMHPERLYTSSAFRQLQSELDTQREFVLGKYPCLDKEVLSGFRKVK